MVYQNACGGEQKICFSLVGPLPEGCSIGPGIGASGSKGRIFLGRFMPCIIKELLAAGIQQLDRQPPLFQERCHSFHSSTWGLTDVTNAFIQRGRQSRCEKADESSTPAERGPDFRGAGHSRGDSLQLEEGVVVAGRGGAGIREGTRGLERRRQVHGGDGDRWPECHRAQCLLP